MRLLQLKNDGEVSLTKNLIRDIPPYAILSHTWGADEEEVTLQDLLDGSGKTKTGYRKIQCCAARATSDGLQYFWVDTCCIDKTNNTELSEAINSMFNWYQDAAICYVYLSDVYEESGIDSSRWFRRGWTLQELLAPQHMVFFDSNWGEIDTRSNMSPTISRITGIPRRLLLLDYTGEFSVAQVMSWAAERETTREEDLAYCLLGLLGINMPLMYGEGQRAFERLQQEYMKISTDHSLFSWRGSGAERGPFARTPAEFRHCKDFTAGKGHSLEYSMTNRGLRIVLPLVKSEDGSVAAILDCLGPDDRRLAIYLKEVRPEVYRRVRCTEELLRFDHIELTSLQRTVYIEPAVSRILGRDRSIPQTERYSFRVDFRAALLKGFCLEGHHSPDDKFQWNVTRSTEGVSVLTVDCSGQYGGLKFHNTESDEHFVVVRNPQLESLVEHYRHWYR